MKGVPAPLHDRVWEKVDRSAGDTACWPWTGAKMHNGYGHIGGGPANGQRTLACHRVAYEAAIGPIPKGMNVLHRCDNRACCNPAHLWLGTQSDNIQDMWDKGRRPRYRLRDAPRQLALAL